MARIPGYLLFLLIFWLVRLYCLILAGKQGNSKKEEHLEYEPLLVLKES